MRCSFTIIAVANGNIRQDLEKSLIASFHILPGKSRSREGLDATILSLLPCGHMCLLMSRDEL